MTSKGAQALHSIGRQLQLLLLWRCSAVESNFSRSRRRQRWSSDVRSQLHCHRRLRCHIH
jgi:hypothetical protein